MEQHAFDILQQTASNHYSSIMIALFKIQTSDIIYLNMIMKSFKDTISHSLSLSYFCMINKDM
ncbi:hypothetical protein T4B_14846 [Trichinella pseudospiralis]|uniref:Uncharacterized protein n=1 Tax=Trichinella pseudospiralis TaxID=6337 RepID=A0A0V1I3P3_TRIPS|nr:hypothetical protein T4B_14846 [Trichinella pseudospiralis]